jgi:eukaryotic-like serine/threonine-protein kinase
VKEDEGHHYYSMDFIEGRTLEDVARENNLSEQQIARYVNLIAEAVEYAHQNGILHRDLKPANVLIDADDEPHVTDFGLAKQLDDDSGLTISGTILGTPSFMSAEQASGRNDEVGPASDVYALGAVLYFLLTGHPPFRGRTSAETIQMVIRDEPHPVRSHNPRISRPLVTICEKCLRKDPKDRYQTAQELAVELERFLRGDPIQAHPVNRFRRLWIWCRDIPLFAALIGRTPSTSKLGQKRLQWTVLILLAVLGIWSIVNAIRAAILPGEIVIASGSEDGMYASVSKQFAENLRERTRHAVKVLPTAGSIENRQLLVTGKAHLGLLQASAVDIEQVTVIAPLYTEFGHVIVRKGSEIETIEDLKRSDLTIVVGTEGSGNRVSALKILDVFGVTHENSSFSELDFRMIKSNRALDVAIVVTGLDNDALRTLLETGEFRLLPIPSRPELFHGTGFHPETLRVADYPKALNASEEISTVATAALLVVHEGERDVIVNAACEALVRDGWIQKIRGHFSPESFSYLTKSLPMHPAAVRFLNPTGRRQRKGTLHEQFAQKRSQERRPLRGERPFGSEAHGLYRGRDRIWRSSSPGSSERRRLR